MTDFAFMVSHIIIFFISVVKNVKKGTKKQVNEVEDDDVSY